MALKVKAVERLLKFSNKENDPGVYRYVLKPDLYTSLSQAEGHSVALPGLGTMRFGLRAKSVEKVEDVKAGLISSRRIIFTPTTDLKDELADTAVQITCYDRNGDEVKRVTSSDPGTVEDPENEENGGNTENGNGSGSGSEGGNTNGGNTGGNTGGGNDGGDDLDKN